MPDTELKDEVILNSASQGDMDAILLRIRARDVIAISLAREGVIGIKGNRVVFGIRHSRRLLGRLIRHARPLPYNALNRIGRGGG